MDYKSLRDNILVAFQAQGIALCLSVITSLLVPKVLGVEEFGYWQLFLLYASYTGFFHFGLNDGVYLLNGGKQREELDKESIASQFWVSACFQLAIAGGIFGFAILGDFGAKRSFVIAATAIYVVIYNLSGFLGFTFQAINETRLYSFSVMVDRLVFLVPLALLLILGVSEFEPYVIAFGASKGCALAYCFWKGRDLVFVRLLPAARALAEAFGSIRVGVKLMLANIASMLILGIMRFTVDGVWGIEIFSQVSFSLTIVNFFMVFINQVSMVLFPALRRVEAGELKGFFRKVRDGLGAFLPGLFLLYFPMKWVLGIWLPQYGQSLMLFALLIPVCAFDGKMNLLYTTYFKVLRWEGRLLAVNALTFACCAAFVAAGVLLVGSVDSVVAASVIAVTGRSLVSEFLLSAEFDCVDMKTALAEVAVTCAFILLALSLEDIYALAAYAVAYAIYLALFNRQTLVGVLARFLGSS